MINLRGLNCYHASIINIIASMGINYMYAFYNLWSEADFDYNQKFCMFNSKRLISNLEALGAKIERISSASPEKVKKELSLLPDEELLLVGMDTFHIPWSPLYQHFYEPHYFYTRIEKADELVCFDPAYGKENVLIGYDDVINYSFNLCRIHKVEAKAQQIELKKEMQGVRQELPLLQKELHTEILACINAGREKINPTIKRIIAMINNRYLFEHFLHQPIYDFDPRQRFFNQEFFLRWKAVKNGLYKSTIVKDNGKVVDEVCAMLWDLLREEISIAEQIGSGYVS